ncbi:MAG: hypothetical protein MZW92_53035 [Comamonadaceae bacterium]|nr:hypothetical protein [Comamonadaceae bacterium]
MPRRPLDVVDPVPRSRRRDARPLVRRSAGLEDDLRGARLRAGPPFRTVLTGYVDETREAPGRYPPATDGPSPSATAPGTTRSGSAPAVCSRWRWRAASPRRRARLLTVDINNPDSRDFLIGDDWFDFLGRCRAVLGVEGGASVFDPDRSLQKAAVDAYVRKRPGAGFEEVRDRCFPGRDGEIRLFAISRLDALDAALCEDLPGAGRGRAHARCSGPGSTTSRSGRTGRTSTRRWTPSRTTRP